MKIDLAVDGFDYVTRKSNPSGSKAEYKDWEAGLGFKPRIASAFGQIPPWPHPRPEDKTGAESPNRWIVKVSPWNARLIRENSSYLNHGLNRNEKNSSNWTRLIETNIEMNLNLTEPNALACFPVSAMLDVSSSVVPWVCFLSWELAWGISVPMGREKEKRGRGEWEKGEGGAER